MGRAPRAGRRHVAPVRTHRHEQSCFRRGGFLRPWSIRGVSLVHCVPQMQSSHQYPLGGGSSMNVSTRSFAAALALAAGMAALVPGAATAQMAKNKSESLDALTTYSDRLNIRQPLDSIDDLHSAIAPAVDDAWARFRVASGDWSATIDSRSGVIASADGAGVPWIPGKGNQLRRSDIASFLGGKAAPDLSVLEASARRFVAGNAVLFGLDNGSLRLNT